jgi:PiT family inorganic phosphate transporter
MEPALLIATLFAGGVFAWTNGFHDAANSVATSLSTGALTPRVAMPLAALLNGFGALIGMEVAETIATRLVDAPLRGPGLTLVLSALIAAIAWNGLTWWWGLPSSSSHALIGGLAGAGLATGAVVEWQVMGTRVLLPMILSPLIGFLGALFLMRIVQAIFYRAGHAASARGFRMAQTVSASAMAVGHGLQDGQKTVGVMTLALVAAQVPLTGAVVSWLRLGVAVALGLGTFAGGWRIIRTLARRVVPLDPVSGFAAETVAATVLYAAAGIYGAPVSSTHAVTAAILGAGATKGVRSIRWRAVRSIALAWVATPIATGVLAGVLALAFGALWG